VVLLKTRRASRAIPKLTGSRAPALVPNSVDKSADLQSVPRPRRNIRPGRLYLVSQQGNKKHPVYPDDEDRAFATHLLHICSLRYGVTVIAYGYGEHEGRWLLKPSTRRGISNLMRDMQGTYSRYLNRKYDHRPCCALRKNAGLEPCHGSQHITNSSNWTARFKLIEADPEQCMDAMNHVSTVLSEQPVLPPTRTIAHAAASSSPQTIRIALLRARRRGRTFKVRLFSPGPRPLPLPTQPRAGLHRHFIGPIRC
jgi:hypothetical protein